MSKEGAWLFVAWRWMGSAANLFADLPNKRIQSRTLNKKYEILPAFARQHKNPLRTLVLPQSRADTGGVDSPTELMPPPSVTAVCAPLVGSGRGIYNTMATQSAAAAGGITRDNRLAAQIRYTAHGIGRCGRAGTGICKKGRGARCTLMWGVMGRGVLPETSNDQKLLCRSCYVIPMYSGSRHSYRHCRRMRGGGGCQAITPDRSCWMWQNSAGRITNRFWSIVN